MTDSCGQYETDTLPTGNLSLTFTGDSLVFFLQVGTFRVLPGDTVYADSTDTVGTVSCMLLPEQTLSPGGPVYVVDVPVESVEEADEVAPSVCLGSGGTLTPFTVQAKNDPRFLQEPRRVFSLQRIANP